MKALRTLRRPRRKVDGFSLLELLIVIMVLSVVLGIIGQIILSVQREYLSQRQLIEAQNSARAALDTLVRLIRIAGNDPERVDFQAIDPDPDGNGQLDSIHLRADWNPADGALDDPYEDIVFSTNNGVLFTQEPTNAVPVEFLDRIESVSFAYFDRNNNPIADPVATPNSIASLDIVMQTRVPGSPPMEFRSSATIRGKE